MSKHNKTTIHAGLLLCLCAVAQPLSAEGVPENLRQWSAGATLSGTATQASFALGANLDGGDGSLSLIFNKDQAVDTHGYIRPQPNDIGKKASLYAVIHTIAGTVEDWYMVNSDSVWTKWDPSGPVPLASYKESNALSSLETIRVTNNMSGIVTKFEVYVGYKTDGDTHYNSQPLKFEVTANPNSGIPDANLGTWMAGTSTGNQSSASSFSIGANLDGDTSKLGVLFNTSQLVDVYARIRPAPADIGKKALIYMVVNGIDNIASEWFMADNKGIWLPWNPSQLPTVNYKQVENLSTEENLRVLNNLTGIASKFKVHVGYQTVGDIHYNPKPFEFEIVANKP